MSDQIEELHDDDFDRLLADKKHKELLGAINKMIKAVKEDDKLAEAIETQSSAINKFISELKSISNTDKGEGKALSLVEAMAKEINENLVELRKDIAKERKTVFELKRDSDGILLKEVIATTKTE